MLHTCGRYICSTQDPVYHNFKTLVNVKERKQKTKKLTLIPICCKQALSLKVIDHKALLRFFVFFP